MGKLRTSKSKLKASGHRLKAPAPRTEAERSRQRYQKNPWRHWYAKAEWKALRLAVADRDLWTCQRTGVLLVGQVNQPNSLIVHHKEPHRGNWELFIDPNNCEAVCKRWHDTVGQKEDNAQN